MPNIDAERESYEFLTWDMKAGDVIAFHALTVHGGPANRSASRRRGYTVRYCGPGMTYYAGPGTTHYLLDDALADGAPIDGPRYPTVFSVG
jgi:ectoine hydroxylase-related dioxygenase (phytanoyl-CoA dioxygenase family)